MTQEGLLNAQRDLHTVPRQPWLSYALIATLSLRYCCIVLLRLLRWRHESRHTNTRL